MNCKEAQDRFSEYVDNALSPQETLELEQHLAECTECARELASWMEVGSALAGTLDCMAVPSTSLEEFVSSVTSVPTQEGTIGRIAAFLATPRRALTATVGGSLAMTTALLFLVWASAYTAPVKHQQQQVVPSRMQYGLVIGRADLQEGSELRNGT